MIQLIHFLLAPLRQKTLSERSGETNLLVKCQLRLSRLPLHSLPLCSILTAKQRLETMLCDVADLIVGQAASKYVEEHMPPKDYDRAPSTSRNRLK